jgi:hypothetical protein
MLSGRKLEGAGESGRLKEIDDVILAQFMPELRVQTT